MVRNGSGVGAKSSKMKSFQIHATCGEGIQYTDRRHRPQCQCADPLPHGRQPPVLRKLVESRRRIYAWGRRLIVLGNRQSHCTTSWGDMTFSYLLKIPHEAITWVASLISLAVRCKRPMPQTSIHVPWLLPRPH